MLTEYTLYRENGTITHGVVEFPEVPTYEDLSRVITPLLGVDWHEFEHVRVWDEGQYRDMFVQENGFALGLPRNEHATKIYRANVLAHVKPTPDPESLDEIVGPAVLFKAKVWF